MILPKDFFAVYGDNLSATGNPKEAYDLTEKEFSRRYNATTSEDVVFRRFKDYESFTAAHRRYKVSGMPEFVKIKIILVNGIK